MRENKTMLEDRFSDHPNPVMYGVVGALFSDSLTGCALLGQRIAAQVEIAATLGPGSSRSFIEGLVFDFVRPAHDARRPRPR